MLIINRWKLTNLKDKRMGKRIGDRELPVGTPAEYNITILDTHLQLKQYQFHGSNCVFRWIMAIGRILDTAATERCCQNFKFTLERTRAS